jgi:hypothetical protein
MLRISTSLASGRGFLCGTDASHRRSYEVFCIDAPMRRCFLLTCDSGTMFSEFGMRDSDSHNFSRRSAHAAKNGRTVHGPQPRPDAAAPISCRSARRDRASKDEHRGAHALHRFGSSRVRTFALMARARSGAAARWIRGAIGMAPATCWRHAVRSLRSPP